MKADVLPTTPRSKTMFTYMTVAGAFAEATKTAERHDRRHADHAIPTQGRKADAASLITAAAEWLGLRAMMRGPVMKNAS